MLLESMVEERAHIVDDAGNVADATATFEATAANQLLLHSTLSSLNAQATKCKHLKLSVSRDKIMREREKKRAKL